VRTLLFLLVVGLLLLTIWLVTEAADVDSESVRVETVASWGHVKPDYVVDERMFTTTVPARARTAPPRRPTMRSAGVHPCGPEFDLPPCWVMDRESGGDINAYNPTGCGGRGCRGKWQCDPRTCSGTGTEEQQDAEARALWNHGAGCAHWQACA
jgi:hypothetical protein